MTDPHPADVRTETISQETKVGWFGVRQLCATGPKTIVSTVVGSMSGRREVMAALDPRCGSPGNPDHAYGESEKLWIDYVADTGDGWDASYSVAYLVGRDRVYLRDDHQPTPQRIADAGTAEAKPPDGARNVLELPGGSILMLGGDQVYPTASAKAYQGHLADPYRCARPGDSEPHERHVYAIPGNHDWYDGLTAFIRLFCQRNKRSIGIWRTQQRRSYFAIRLREGWWLWAADLALEDDLDPPQQDYFTDQAALLKPDDRVILCLPEPTWVEAFDPTAREVPEVSQQADKARLIEKRVRLAGARVVLALAGDLHHYARHESDGPNPTQYFTCGGGGAFTLGTSRQPRMIRFSDGDTATLQKCFPTDEESRALRWWSLLFPMFSPGFTALLGLYILLMVYLLHSASRLTRPSSWLDQLMSTPLSLAGALELLSSATMIAVEDAITLLFASAMVGGCIAFARSGRGSPRNKAQWMIAGTSHGLLQLLAGLSCCWLAARAMYHADGGTLLILIAFTVTAAAFIFIVNGLLFGAYLLATNLAFGMHEQEVFSCQSIEQYKCFLRICVERDHATVYPIGLRQPAQSWKTAPGVKRKSSRVWPNLSREEVLEIPVSTTRLYDPVNPLEPELIEAPIVVR